MKIKESFPGVTSLLLIIVFTINAFMACSKKNENKVFMKRDQMIVEKLEQAEKYYDLHPAFERAFTFLRQENLSELELGRHELDGERLFCTKSKSNGRQREVAKLEAHKKFIDIQYVISGDEEMGWKPIRDCKLVETSYDENRDVAFFNDEPQSWSKVPPGYFTIFFPDDAHAPGIGDGEIHKVVFKVAVK